MCGGKGLSSAGGEVSTGGSKVLSFGGNEELSVSSGGSGGEVLSVSSRGSKVLSVSSAGGEVPS